VSVSVLLIHSQKSNGSGIGNTLSPPINTTDTLVQEMSKYASVFQYHQNMSTFNCNKLFHSQQLTNFDAVFDGLDIKRLPSGQERFIAE